MAIKQILTQPTLSQADKDVVRQRAAREARNAARFQHPNAIVVFDITEHEGDPCLVMEYLPSQSLAVVLSSQGTLPLPQVARIGEQVASALIAAHRAGIVHRDVKPGNILLGDNGAVKITDFGISKAKGDVTLTATGLISGTAAYLAPEVARGAEPTPAADVFALGATLFHALEGEPPYGTNPNPLALLYAAANGQLSEPRNAGPLEDLLRRLLSFEPEDRPSMHEVRDRMADFAEVGPDADATRVLAARRPQQRGPEAPRRPAPPRQPTRPIDRRPSANADIPTGAVSAAALLESTPPPRPPTSHGPATHTAMEPHADEPGSRKFVWIALVSVLVVVGGVIAAMLNSGGGEGGSGVDAGGPTTSKVTGAPQTTEDTSALGEAKNAGTVNVGQAGLQIKYFYDALLSDSYNQAWSMLTPAAQQVYGDFDAFQEFWSQNRVADYQGIAGSNGADGSAEMTLSSITYGGRSKSLSLRVVESPSGRLVIDSATK